MIQERRKYICELLHKAHYSRWIEEGETKWERRRKSEGKRRKIGWKNRGSEIKLRKECGRRSGREERGFE